MTRRAYARVSGDGQDLDSQLKLLKREGYHELYYEKKTGTKISKRPEFEKLLNDLQDGDTLIVTKLDRFARNTSEAIDTIKKLFEKGVRVHVINMGLLEDTPTGRLMFSVIAAFAEFERDIIVERTQEGKAAKKALLGDAYKEGRKRVYAREHVYSAIALIKEGQSVSRTSRQMGIPIRTLYREINRYKIEVEGKKKKNENVQV